MQSISWFVKVTRRFGVLQVAVGFAILWAACGKPPSAAAASFDCSKAQNNVEHVVCAFPELSELDSQMARLYFDSRASQEAADSAQIVVEQRAFLRRRGGCDSQSRVSQLSLTELVGVRDCLVGVYQQRIRELRDSGSSPTTGSQPLPPPARVPPPVAIQAPIPVPALPATPPLRSPLSAGPDHSSRCPRVGSLSFDFIPGDSFMLGNNQGRFSDEAPQHRQTIQSFCVMRDRLDPVAVKMLLTLLGDVSLPMRVSGTRALQRRLEELHYLEEGSSDGRIGPKTTAATRQFQERNSLPATGEFDTPTVSALSQGAAASLSSHEEDAVFSYSEAMKLTELISSKSGYRVRLLREPEWEYLSQRQARREAPVVEDLYADWELTLSVYAPYPYVADESREGGGDRDAFRSIRGGSLEDMSEEGKFRSPTLRGFAAPSSRYPVRLTATPLQ